jgi:double-stranded uracil-DNA glycosylase
VFAASRSHRARRPRVVRRHQSRHPLRPDRPPLRRIFQPILEAAVFWKLLFESKLVSEPIDWRADDRLPEWGFGITNLVARETPGIDTLSRQECTAGIERLRAKVRRFKPEIVAFVGVSLYRWIFDVKGAVALGAQRITFEGAQVFVLPNPSGRNANFTYAEMLAAFRKLRRRLG